MIARTDPTKAKSASPGKDQALFTTDGPKHSLEKTIATIRAKLCHCGGQVLHVATDGSFFVVTPWQQITKFDDLALLQAHADRGAR